MLHPYRVLDLTDCEGWFAAFLLAQLGADVTLGEPEGGWERGVAHDAYNRGKSSVIVTDVASVANRFDVIVHNGRGDLAELTSLRAQDPALITVSITPFGETGPKAGWLATDLTLFASAGQMAVTGDRDRPPVRTTVPQAWLHGCADAAVAILVALHERSQSGLGQHIDCSVQQSVCLTAVPAILFAPAGLEPGHREAGGVRFEGTHLRWTYPASDGHIALALSFGPMIGPFQRRLMDWVFEEGHCTDELRSKDWVGMGLALASGEEPIETLETAMDAIGSLTRTKTKAELLAGALERRLLVAPVSTMADVVNSPQLEDRGYWDVIDGVRHPGAIVAAGATPLPPLPAAERMPGQGSLPAAPRAPVEAAATPSPDGQALAGVKVLDLAWVAAGPLATRTFAYWGAEVVRIESSTRPDLTRVALGHRDDVQEVENAITWHAANAGKLAVALNLAVPEARSVVRELAAWADVVVESFTPGTMAKWGLGYDDLAAINPELVMLSSCVMGQNGPWSTFAGFGNLSASVAGFFDITGWPDRGPAGPYMAYTDYTSPRFTMCALLAALDHRRRTGQGQYLDFSQMEAATHLLSSALLEFQRTGEIRGRQGNLDPDAAPHAVYPALGDDEWIAIACQSDQQWRALAEEMHLDPELADLTTQERIDRRSELDELIETWTARQDPTGLHYRLQAIGVPAHRVQNSGECFGDPQLAHRGHFQFLHHDHVSRAIVDTQPMHLSRTPGEYRWAGATYGEHTMEVLTRILGYDGDRIAELAVSGALE